MFGLLSLFGRNRDLRVVDDALRAAGLHPALVPEAVKLTVLRLLGSRRQDSGTVRHAADLLAYLMLGGEVYEDATDAAAHTTAEARVAQAVEDGDSLDAQLVLLAMQAGVVQPSVLHRFGLEAETE